MRLFTDCKVPHGEAHGLELYDTDPHKLLLPEVAPSEMARHEPSPPCPRGRQPHKLSASFWGSFTTNPCPMGLVLIVQSTQQSLWGKTSKHYENELVSFYFYSWVILVKKSINGDLFAYFLLTPVIVCDTFRSLLQEKQFFWHQDRIRSPVCAFECTWEKVSNCLSLISSDFLIINDKLWKTEQNKKTLQTKSNKTKPKKNSQVFISFYVQQ